MKRIILCLLLLVCTGIQARKETTQTPCHPWAGKRIGYIGDSITDPNMGAGWLTHYWQFLQEWLGSTPLVYAVSGYTWNHAPGLVDKLHAEHGQEVDGILFFLGTNDFNEDLPLGVWFTEKAEQVERGRNGEPNHIDTRMHRTLSLDKGTLRGRINIAMQHVKTLYPTKQIIIMTPIHRAYASFGKGNVQPDEFYCNELNLYFETYVDAIVEASAIWSVPVVDLYRQSGLNPMIESQVQYFCNSDTDRLHPNTEGHKRLARTIWQQLMMFPCEF